MLDGFLRQLDRIHAAIRFHRQTMECWEMCPCHQKRRDLTTPCTKCRACHVKHDPVSPHQHTSCKTRNGTELSRQLRDGGQQRRTQLNPHTPLNTHSEEIIASVLQLWPQFFKEEVEISGRFSSFGILFVVQSRSLRSNLWKKRSQPTAFSHHIWFWNAMVCLYSVLLALVVYFTQGAWEVFFYFWQHGLLA